MKEHLKLVEIRGTIFIPQIPFSWGLVNELTKSLTDYIPTVNMSPNPILLDGASVKPNVLAPCEWSLVAPNQKQQVLFLAQKIDLLKSVNVDYAPEAINEFAKTCQALFKIFPEFTSHKCTRIAIAPTFEYTGDDIMPFTRDIFKKNDFQNAALDNCDFSQVFRLRENILDKQIYINYLSKFYAMSRVISANGINQLAEVTMINFDINSKVDPDVVFTQEAIGAFFTNAPIFCEKFLSFYFNE